jgi:hypothetical protein
MFLRIPVSEDERRNLAVFVIAYGVTIVAWASVHDIYLIGVEPRHFTAYHRPLLPISNHTLLALQYALIATLGPGMVFGAITFVTCRLGSWPQIEAGKAWCLFLPVIAFIESVALLAGTFARSRYDAGLPLPYPAIFYPDTTAGIAYSQSVNITAYLAATGIGFVYQLGLLLHRRHLAHVHRL